MRNFELIVGPVCSGKSAELIRRVDRYQIAGQKTLLVKPSIDSRSEYIKSRNGTELKCVKIKNVEEIIPFLSEKYDIIAFDEAQFFDGLFNLISQLLKRKYKVILSALDADFHGESFKEVPKLIILADSVTKLTAICMKCRSDNAIFSQKLVKGGNQIQVGDLDLYEPRCSKCFIPGGLD